MKTTLQALIDTLKVQQGILDNEGNYVISCGLYAAQRVAEALLEKEKEQIMNAFEVGYKSCDIDEAFEINRKLASGEKYYNKTYKQNK